MGKKKERERDGTSVADAIRALRLIETTLDNLCATAPCAVAEMGGRDAMRRACHMTCVGPMPRLSVEQWSAMAVENQARWAMNVGSDAPADGAR